MQKFPRFQAIMKNARETHDFNRGMKGREFLGNSIEND